MRSPLSLSYEKSNTVFLWEKLRLILLHNAHRIRQLLSLSQAAQDIGLSSTFPRSRAESLFQTLLSSAAKKPLTHADLRLQKDRVSLLSRAHHISPHTLLGSPGSGSLHQLRTMTIQLTSAAVLLYRGFRDLKRTYYAFLHVL